MLGSVIRYGIGQCLINTSKFTITGCRQMPRYLGYSTFYSAQRSSSSRSNYVLPTVDGLSPSKITILDPSFNKTCKLPPCLKDINKILPTLDKNIPEIVEPDSSTVTEKLAKTKPNVLKNRRRRMNRHKLKKLRKKMKHEYARVIVRRKKHKEDAFMEVLNGIQADAEKFDAEKEVHDVLEQARKGGYKIDIFAGRA